MKEKKLWQHQWRNVIRDALFRPTVEPCEDYGRLSDPEVDWDRNMKFHRELRKQSLEEECWQAEESGKRRASRSECLHLGAASLMAHTTGIGLVASGAHCEAETSSPSWTRSRKRLALYLSTQLLRSTTYAVCRATWQRLSWREGHPAHLFIVTWTRPMQCSVLLLTTPPTSRRTWSTTIGVQRWHRHWTCSTSSTTARSTTPSTPTSSAGTSTSTATTVPRPTTPRERLARKRTTQDYPPPDHCFHDSDFHMVAMLDATCSSGVVAAIAAAAVANSLAQWRLRSEWRREHPHLLQHCQRWVELAGWMPERWPYQHILP